MFTAFTVIFLYLACILPMMRISMYFLCSVFVMGLVVEEEYGFAWLNFVATCLISLFIMPDRLRLIPYALFFGHYGIMKSFIEKKLRDKVICYVVKLLYFNAALVGTYFLAGSVLTADVTVELPIWALALLANAAFAVYDYAFSKVTLVYVNRIRRWLLK